MRKQKKERIFFNLGWMKLIGWFSVILFLVDYAERSGKWRFHIIAIVFVVTSIGAMYFKWREYLNKKEKRK